MPRATPNVSAAAMLAQAPEYAVDDPWEAFLVRRQRGGDRGVIPADVLERVRSRAAWPDREPTMMLYEGLLLVELGDMSIEELQSSIDENEELDRSLRRKLRANARN
jgi:hypothetical protein